MDTLDVTAADGSINVLIVNREKHTDRTIAAGKPVGTAEVVQNNDLAELNSMPTTKLTPTSRAKWEHLRTTIRHGFKGQEAEDFWHLIGKYSNIFLANKYDLGCADKKFELELKMKSRQPIHLKQFRLPWSALALMNEHIRELLKCKVIQPSTSAFNSPVFVVPKKSGKPRIVQNMRRINAGS